MFRSARVCLILMLTAAPVLSVPAYADVQKVKNEQAAPAKDAQQERSKVFNAETFTLDNGLEVIVVPNHRVPVVTQMVWYKAGAADEAWGHSGIAHFMEHIMFKGSPRIGDVTPLGPGEFSQIIRSIGGQDNAFTSKDYMAYFQSVPADQLETIMRMEAGRMKEITPSPADVESERKVVIEERRMRTDNDPRAQFQEQMVEAAFPNHPYGIPTIGWMSEMEKMDWQTLKNFHDTWCAPNNAILIVTGDVTPAAVYQMAIDIYGTLPRKEIPARVWPQSPPLPAPVVLTLKDPKIQESAVQTLYRLPSAHKNKAEALALDVLSEILAGGPSGRLYQSLVVQQKIASNADFSYDPNAIDDAQGWLYATPVKGQSLDSVKKALDAELQKIIDKGVSEQELNDAKTRLKDATIYALDSLSGPAMQIGYALVTGSSLDDIEYWPHDIENVSAAQIQAVVTKYLNPNQPWEYPPVTGYIEAAPGADGKTAARPYTPSGGMIR